jgi:hypothetical protein
MIQVFFKGKSNGGKDGALNDNHKKSFTHLSQKIENIFC